MNTEIFPNDPASIELAVELLRQDEVVALPTETVYGLAGNAFSESSLRKVFEAKERPTHDPLIVHISDEYLQTPKGLLSSLITDGLIDGVSLDPSSTSVIEKIMRRYWPGPLTLILPRGPGISDLVTAGQATVAIRCPAHPIFQDILRRLDFPLAAPSANRFGRISPTEASDVIQELEGKISAVLDGGPCSIGIESTILQINFPLSLTLLRPGQINAQELAKEFNLRLETQTSLNDKSAAVVAPGMLDEHYAPKKPLFLLNQPLNEVPAALLLNLCPAELRGQTALLSMGPVLDSAPGAPFIRTVELSSPLNTERVAQCLYQSMRILDNDPEVHAILADVPPQDLPLSLAIRDRLKRASRNKPSV